MIKLTRLQLAIAGAVLAAINIAVPLISNIGPGVQSAITGIVLLFGALGLGTNAAAAIHSFVSPTVANFIGLAVSGLGAWSQAWAVPNIVHAVIGGVLAFAVTLGFTPAVISTTPVDPVLADPNRPS